MKSKKQKTAYSIILTEINKLVNVAIKEYKDNAQISLIYNEYMDEQQHLILKMLNEFYIGLLQSHLEFLSSVEALIKLPPKRRRWLKDKIEKAISDIKMKDFSKN